MSNKKPYHIIKPDRDPITKIEHWKPRRIIQERRCLKCDLVFISHGYQNRMCDKCRTTTETIFDIGHEINR